MKKDATMLHMYWNALLSMCVVVLATCFPDLAHAADAGYIGETLCNAAGLIQGNAGKGIATVMVVSLGVGAMLGKVSWGMAITLGVGVGVIFGAGSIFAKIYGGSGCYSSSTTVY